MPAHDPTPAPAETHDAPSTFASRRTDREAAEAAGLVPDKWRSPSQRVTTGIASTNELEVIRVHA